MTPAQGSLKWKIVVPIFTIFAASTAVLLAILLYFSHAVTKRYMAYVHENHAAAIHRSLDGAVDELVGERLSGVPSVVEAKKQVALREVERYLGSKGLEGVVRDWQGRNLLSTLAEGRRPSVEPYFSTDGPFHMQDGLVHANGYSFHFPAWGWRIVLVGPPVVWLVEMGKTELGLLLPAIFVMGGAFVGVVFMILRSNLQIPIDSLLGDLSGGRKVEPTGIRELDTIGEAINGSMDRLRRKAAQVQALHDVALSVHGKPPDEAVRTILESVGGYLGAACSALALYGPGGEAQKVISVGSLPGGVPVPGRGDHSPGDGPEGPPALADRVVRNRAGEAFVAYPLPSDEGLPAPGVLLFGGKAGGFTEEDDTLLRAVATDTALALSKAARVAELNRFQQVIDSAFDLVLLIDDRGRVSYANPACEGITGYRADEIAGRDAAAVAGATADGATLDSIRRSLRPGAAWRGTLSGRRKDGEPFHTSALLFALKGAEPHAWACIQRDVSEERKLYDHLLRSQKLEAMGTLAGGIAHDFNNILAAVLGYADLLVSSPDDPEKVREYSRTIYNAANQGAELARKLLASTRKEAVRFERVDLNAVVGDSLTLLSRSIPKNIEVTARLGNDVPPVEGDPSQLQQVIVNLAVNARDAMPSGGRLVIATEAGTGGNVGASGITSPGRRWVRLTVSDTGVGMDEHTRGKIFDPFFTTKEAGKGTGLGLFIVHSVVTGHGGAINIYSEPGRGTRFSIYLPAAHDPSAVTASPSREDGREEPPPGGSGTVLVVDDEPNVLDMCSALLASLGYTVLSAGGGPEGLAIFRARRGEIRAVILDLIMPRMGGGEVYGEIRRLDPDVKVILCSGYSPDGYEGIEALLSRGVSGFLPKPFTRASIAKVLRHALGG